MALAQQRSLPAHLATRLRACTGVLFSPAGWLNCPSLPAPPCRRADGRGGGRSAHAPVHRRRHHQRHHGRRWRRRRRRHGQRAPPTCPPAAPPPPPRRRRRRGPPRRAAAYGAAAGAGAGEATAGEAAARRLDGWSRHRGARAARRGRWGGRWDAAPPRVPRLRFAVAAEGRWARHAGPGPRAGCLSDACLPCVCFAAWI